MVVKIDERSSLILVQKDGVIVLNRTIPYGIDTMVSAISETSSWGNFDSYKAALDLSMKKACILSRFYREESAITPVPGAEGYAVEKEVGAEQLTPLKKDKIAVTNSLSALVGGISKVVDYYNANHSDEPIEKMYITGVGADVAGMAKLLSNEIGFNIDKLVNFTGVNVEKNFKDVNFSEFVACIGAAMAPVHFSSERDAEKGKSKKKSSSDSTRLATILCAGCIVVGLVLVFASMIPYLAEVKKQKEYNAIIEELQPVYEVYLNYLTLEGQAKQMELLDKETLNRNQELVTFIETLEQKMPTSFVLNDLTTTAEGITMNVSVTTKEEAAAVLEELRKLEMFIFVDTTSLSELISEIGEIKYTFTVEMQYAPIVEETTEGEE